MRSQKMSLSIEVLPVITPEKREARADKGSVLSRQGRGDDTPPHSHSLMSVSEHRPQCFSDQCVCDFIFQCALDAGVNPLAAAARTPRRALE